MTAVVCVLTWWAYINLAALACMVLAGAIRHRIGRDRYGLELEKEWR